MMRIAGSVSPLAASEEIRQREIPISGGSIRGLLTAALGIVTALTLGTGGAAWAEPDTPDSAAAETPSAAPTREDAQAAPSQARTHQGRGGEAGRSRGSRQHSKPVAVKAPAVAIGGAGPSPAEPVVAQASTRALALTTVSANPRPALAAVTTPVALTSVEPLAAAAPPAATETAQPAGIMSGFASLLGGVSSRGDGGVPAVPIQFVTATLALIGSEIQNRLIRSGLVTGTSQALLVAPAAAKAVGNRKASPPTVSIADASVAEGAGGTSPMTFTLTMSKAWNTPVTIGYATSDSTATAGSDYVATSGTVTFAKGQTSQTVNVGVIGDTLVEPNETLNMTLSNPTGASITRGVATGTILDDDIASPPTVSIADASVAEGAGGTSPMAFTLTMSQASNTPVTIGYATSNSTATAGSDYVATSGTVTFAQGQTSQTVNVGVIGDTVVEPDETLTLTLSNPMGASISRGVATGTILNDDIASPPTTTTVEAETMTASPSTAGRVVADGAASGGSALALTGSATASTTVDLAAATGVTIRARTSSGAPNMTLLLDGVPVTTVVVRSTAWSDYTIAGSIAAGSHVLGLSSSNATAQQTLYLDTITARTGAIGDDFTGAAGVPNSTIWTVCNGSGCGWDSGVETYASNNAYLDGQGNLVLQAVKTAAGGYTSGWVESRNKMSFGYGTLTARIKVPKGQGLWPAFWLKGADEDTTAWPQSGEIDVFELPSTTTTIYSTLHGPIAGTSSTQQAQIIANVPDLSAGYHNFWVRHLPDEITFGVDNQTLGTLTPASLAPGSTWVYNRPMHVTLNLAVGGPWAGSPDSSTQFPATMLVDSVQWVPA